MKRNTSLVVLICLAVLMMGGFESVAGSPIKIVGELMAGALGGLACGLEIATLYDGRDPDPDGWAGPFSYATLITGVVLGSSAGVYLVGNIGDEIGSFSSALAGGTLGALFTFGGCLLMNLNASRHAHDEWANEKVPEVSLSLGCLSSAFTASIGAVIGFNKMSRHESSSGLDVHSAPPIYFNLLRMRF